MCGAGGFNGNDNQARIPVTDLVEAINLSFDGDGWCKIPGGSRLFVDPLAGSNVLVGAHDWHPASLTQRLISTWDGGAGAGVVYKDDGAAVDATTLKSGLTFTDPVVFVECGQEDSGNNKKLIMFSKNVMPQVLTGDGDKMTNVAAPNTDWGDGNYPAAGIRLSGRVLAFGCTNWPHAVYGCDPVSHETFNGGNSFATDIWAGEGEYVAAIIPFIASDGSTRIYAFKYPFGMYWLDLSDVTSPIAFKLRDDIGMAGPLGWCRAGNDVLLMSSTGSIHSLTAVMSSEDLSASDISMQLNLRKWLKANMDFSKLKTAVLVHDDIRKEIRVSFRTMEDSTANGTGFLTDLRLQNPRIGIEKRGEILNVLFRRRTVSGDYEICGGGADGYIYRFGQENRNLGGAAYTATFKTIDTDLGFYDDKLAGEEKRFDYLEATMTPTGSYPFAIEVYIDGVLSETVSMPLGLSGASVFGTATFGLTTLATAGYFSGKSLTSHKVEIHGRGQTIALRGISAGLNEDFSLSELAVWCQKSGTKGTD